MPDDRVTRRSLLMTALGGASMLAIPWELVAAELHHHGLEVPPAATVLSVDERRLVEAIVASTCASRTQSGFLDVCERNALHRTRLQALPRGDARQPRQRGVHAGGLAGAAVSGKAR